MKTFHSFLRKISLTLSATLLAVSAHASVLAPQNGQEYLTLERQQPTEPGKKVEVIEFFAFWCPHCNALEPLIEDWVKRQGDKINFKRIHVDFGRFPSQQKLFYTLEAMGRIDLMPKVFNAIHAQRKSLASDAEVEEFIVAQGVDKTKFAEVYKSFTIQSKLSRLPQLMQNYRVDGVPFVAVDGRYTATVTTASSSMGNAPEDMKNKALLQVLDYLVDRGAKTKTPAATPTTKPATEKKK
jgi:protein dithiol oxidoreductase (disulfide-forming)